MSTHKPPAGPKHTGNTPFGPVSLPSRIYSIFEHHVSSSATHHTAAMYIRAATRKNFTTSLFTTTALIAVFTVAAPQLMPCPVSNGLANDEKKEKEQAE
ncbi:hypothetical protein LXG23DRAFT_55336 [Yarrowia lipolytica]|nr:hypothetical protein LXG23DRAFT_55336 [Yarrowia lipolytica]